MHFKEVETLLLEREREHDTTSRSGVDAPRGASASSRMKTERQIGLLIVVVVELLNCCFL